MSFDQIVARAWGVLKKYIWLLLITSALGLAGAHFYTERLPRVYNTKAKFHYVMQDQNIFGRQFERVDMLETGGVWQFRQFWNTQRQILMSQKFAQRVALRANLLAREDLVPRTRGDGTTRTEEERLESAGSMVRGMVSITMLKDSRVVEVSATGTDPELIAMVATEFINSYIDYTNELQSGGLNQMISWFDTYVSTKRKELNDAQLKLNQFKRDNSILSISYEDRQNLTGANMGAINTQLNEVKTQLAREESMLVQIKKIRKGDGDMRVIGALVGDESLNSSVQRESLLEEQLARLRGLGRLEEHREVVSVTRELEAIRTNIDAALVLSRDAISNRVATLKRERSRLARELESLKQDAFALDTLGVEYSQLRDNAENLKKLYISVLKRSEELDINSMYESESIQLIEAAAVPGSPTSPRVPVNLALGLALGLAFGGGVVFLIFQLDTTVRSEQDVARYTDRPILGALPTVDSNTLKGLTLDSNGSLDMITHIAPKSAFAEGIKSLRTNLTFISPGSPPKLFLVTSPGPGEGKTTTSVNMAIAMAQSGLKTILIDADLRRPRVHKALGMENIKGNGIANVIAGDIVLDDAVRETGVDNMSVLTCGDIPPNPSELLHADRFIALIDELSEKFDRVVFDSPPLGAVSDALIVSHCVDATLLVLKFGHTRRELLRRAVDQLVTVGAPFTGCVLNDIDASGSGYGYSYYYYYRYNYSDDAKNKDGSKIAS